jgi:hypothetical protein
MQMSAVTHGLGEIAVASPLFLFAPFDLMTLQQPDPTDPLDQIENLSRSRGRSECACSQAD